MAAKSGRFLLIFRFRCPVNEGAVQAKICKDDRNGNDRVGQRIDIKNFQRQPASQ
jgi:hypothetical protein